MQTAIRISFRQNAEYLMEGQKEAMRRGQRNPKVSPRVQNIIIGGAFAAGLILFVVDEHQRGGRMTTILVAIIGCLVIMAGWFWFFKKTGLLKRMTSIYELTDKELPRYQKYHRKLTGVDEMDVTWEFGEAGVNLVTEAGPASGYAWNAVSKVIELQRGFLMFIRRKGPFSLPIYLWFRKSAFNSELDCEAFRKLVKRNVVSFETDIPSPLPAH